jgi:hypothetical protein
MKKEKLIKLWLVPMVGAMLILATACELFLPTLSPTEAYSEELKTWVGRDINDCISSWGPPSDVYTMPNGNKMYTWLWNGGTVVVTDYNYWLRQSLTNSVTYWCKTTMTVDTSDYIINWRHEGNACQSH